MTYSSQQLPQPDINSLAQTQRVFDRVAEEIKLHGPIDFARYMELVLYAPGLGYYSSGTKKFGVGGDFVTAPEISPLFSHCIARSCHEVLQHLPKGEILELGAGTGKMAAEILLQLAEQNVLPEKYLILEVSADLRLRQQNTLRERCPELLHKVHWLNQHPKKPWSGVILANEVFDAMPVARFSASANEINEIFVDIIDGRLCERKNFPRSKDLHEAVVELQKKFFSHNEVYVSEINLQLEAFLNSFSDVLDRGVFLIIDYGFPAHEYYHEERDRGTLMCHYQHRAHADPYIFPGLQDITAHVDFTSLAKSAEKAGLQIAGYTTQAAFLLGCGILEFNAMINDPEQKWALANQIKKLTLPSEMGELFKMIGLSKNFQEKLTGFSLLDMSDRL